MSEKLLLQLCVRAVRRECLLEELLLRTIHPNGGTEAQRREVLDRIDDAAIASSEVLEKLMRGRLTARHAARKKKK